MTGIELAPEYVEIAQPPARRAGLADKVTLVQGDALDLPFPDEAFDAPGSCTSA